MTVPVVFIHFGHGEYLPYVLDQAKKWSDQVILMGTLPMESEPFRWRTFLRIFKSSPKPMSISAPMGTVLSSSV